jgi:hypothetical protein
MGQHGAEPLPRPETQRGGGRCADMDKRAQGGEVTTADIRVVHHLEQLRLDQEEVGDPLGLDQGEGVGGVVAIPQHDATAAQQRDVHQRLGEIGQVAVDELPAGIGALGALTMAV